MTQSPIRVMPVITYAAFKTAPPERAMPVFQCALSEVPFRRFMLKLYASNLLVDMNLEAQRDTLENTEYED